MQGFSPFSANIAGKGVMILMDIKKKVEDIFDIAAQPTIDIVSSMFIEGFTGTLLPGVTSAMLAYKQKRAERMLERFMIETKKRVNELEEKLIKLEPEKYKEFSEKYFGIVTDYVIDEVQEEKIKYIVNGFINLASIKDIKEDFVLYYYDTLKSLRIVDIAVLKLYYEPVPRSYIEILQTFGIEYEQYDSIREKLVRMGLLTTKREKREDDLYTNLLIMQDFLEKVSKGKKADLKRFKHIEKHDTFIISKFGRDFMEFFIESNSEQDNL